MKRRELTGRELLALLVAPLLPGLAFAARSQFSPDAANGPLTAFLAWGFVGYAYSLATLCVLGLPLYFLARRFGFNKWWCAAAAGAVVAAFTCIMLRLSPTSFFVPLGAATGVLFWLVANSHDAQPGVPADGSRPAGEPRR